MYEMIEAGLRGGMTQTTCKKVEATNRYMGTDCEKKKAVIRPIWMRTAFVA